MSKITKHEQEKARDTLRELLPPGATVYTNLRHVSPSGMSRLLNTYVIQDNTPLWLDSLVASAVGLTRDKKREALRVGGCGMDMGFHVVSTLSSVLYPDGFDCIGGGCPSNDHSNGDRDYTLGHHHQSGGYALKQRWM